MKKFRVIVVFSGADKDYTVDEIFHADTAEIAEAEVIRQALTMFDGIYTEKDIKKVSVSEQEG